MDSQSSTSPESPAQRAARIAEIRRQIAEGSYDTDARLAAAVDAMLNRWEAVERTCKTHWPK